MALADRKVTVHDIIQSRLDRIAAYDQRGPVLNAIININPQALASSMACR